MNLLDFLHDIIGISNDRYDFIFIILAGCLTLISIDGILSFIFGGLSGINRR